jgi:heme/copper-type cytochrome/quinol oxidase subunit 2
VAVWLGILGPPVAWTVQHVGGTAIRRAQCSVANTRWMISANALTIVFTAAAAVIVLGGLAGAIAAYRATNDAGDDPPASRIHFLSIVGITIAPLFLAIILMSGLGSLFLSACRQS